MTRICILLICSCLLAACSAVSTPSPTTTPPPAPATATLTPAPTLVPSLTPTPTIAPGASQVSQKDGMTLLYVPAGDFTMGSNNADLDERPAHQVYLDAFWIDQTEVTTAMYRRCVQAGGCTKPVRGLEHQVAVAPQVNFIYFWDVDYFANYPIIEVNWDQAVAYCTWAGRRLPTEAEWEKAARGTDGRTYPWGNPAPRRGMLNFENLWERPVNVGSYSYPLPTPVPPPPGATPGPALIPDYNSPYGAFDMAGNVWEYVSDWYVWNYYAQSPSSDPHGPPSGYGRVVRGGSFANIAYLVRTTARAWFGEGGRLIAYGTVGFRCAASY